MDLSPVILRKTAYIDVLRRVVCGLICLLWVFFSFYFIQPHWASYWVMTVGVLAIFRFDRIIFRKLSW